MIGGIEIRIPTRAGLSSTTVSVRAIRQSWPNAIFENGLTGDHYEHFRQIPFARVEELFVYRNSDAARLWDAEGAVPGAFNSMIHIIADQDMLTVVIDEEDAEMDSVIAAIRSGLADEIHYIPVIAA